MVKKLLIVFLVLGLSVNALAQQVSRDDYKTTVYVTKSDINVRESPPSKGFILISGPGKVAFEVKKDTAVIVVEKQVIESVFSKTIWVKIKVQDSKKEGWIYWGDNEEKSENLTLRGVN